MRIQRLGIILGVATTGLLLAMAPLTSHSHAQAVDSGPFPPVAALPAVPNPFGEALFYAVPGASSLSSFRNHADQIAVIAPQSFALDRLGTLRGYLPADLAAVAHQNGVQIMPLVINADFSRVGATRLIQSANARDHAVGALVQQAVALDLSGWQIDFENLPSTQRAAFSRFVSEVAEALHRHGKLLSVAVGARTSDDPTTYTYKTFSGVYDYAALGESADFLSIMAYPEGDSSHPGPLASYPWVNKVVQHVLLQLPADKLSLGLPTYQSDWSERRIRVSVVQKVGTEVKRVFHFIYKLVRQNGAVNYTDDAPLQWDPVLQSSFRIVGEGHARHVTWVEDVRSFDAKLGLVSQYHLRGFSVWRIGLEDSLIWRDLPVAPRAAAAAAANPGPGQRQTGPTPY